jgi:transposase InsO family protein
VGVVLTEAQVVALEKAKTEKEAHGEFESEHPGYCGAQDTFYVGNLKGVGRVYQQTFIDTYSKVACAKLYDRKTPITAADLLNDRVLPLFDEHNVKLLRVLTDRGSEYCGNPERHEYELYLAVEDIDHSRTKTKSPQTNGICERFHKTVLNEFYRVASAKRCIVRLMSCRPISICGSVSTMSTVLIRDVGASGKPRCRPSWIPCLSRRRK